jgi:hypothetical protein
MKKSVRTLALIAVVSLSSAPMFANVMGTNPHPQAVSFPLSGYLNIFLTVAGF